MNVNKIAERTFKLLKGMGYTIKPYDESGNEVIDPTEAERFFVSKPNFMISVSDDGIQMNKSQTVGLGEVESLIASLRRMSDEYLLNFTVKDFGKTLSPKKFAFQAKKKVKDMSSVNEARLGRLYGYAKTSYQNLGEVKIIYRHTKGVNEEAPMTRSRNIRSITLEHNGEQFIFPNNFVLGARALARHVHEGGTWDDDVANYICEASRRCKRMKEFVRYAKTNSNLIEGNDDVMALVKENIAQMTYDFKKFIAPTTYQTFKEKFEQAELKEVNDVANLKDQFTKKNFDMNLESVLPYINGLLKEKEDFERSILSVLETGVNFAGKPRFSPVLEFDTTEAKLSYKLKETANVLEDESLSTFLGRISEKIASQQTLTEFEIKVVKEVLTQARDTSFG